MTQPIFFGSKQRRTKNKFLKVASVGSSADIGRSDFLHFLSFLKEPKSFLPTTFNEFEESNGHNNNNLLENGYNNSNRVVQSDFSLRYTTKKSRKIFSITFTDCDADVKEFDEIRRMNYESADAILLTFTIKSRKSFDELERIILDVNKHSKRANVFMVGVNPNAVMIRATQSLNFFNKIESYDMTMLSSSSSHNFGVNDSNNIINTTVPNNDSNILLSENINNDIENDKNNDNKNDTENDTAKNNDTINNNLLLKNQHRRRRKKRSVSCNSTTATFAVDVVNSCSSHIYKDNKIENKSNDTINSEGSFTDDNSKANKSSSSGKMTFSPNTSHYCKSSSAASFQIGPSKERKLSGGNNCLFSDYSNNNYSNNNKMTYFSPMSSTSSLSSMSSISSMSSLSSFVNFQPTSFDDDDDFGNNSVNDNDDCNNVDEWVKQADIVEFAKRNGVVAYVPIHEGDYKGAAEKILSLCTLRFKRNLRNRRQKQ